MAKLTIGDRLHRGFVLTCIGITLFGALNIAVKGYEYMVHVRPVRKAEELRMQQELLREGQANSEQLPA